MSSLPNAPLSPAGPLADTNQLIAERRDKLRALRPLNAYGYSKQLFDLWAQRKGLLSSIASLN